MTNKRKKITTAVIATATAAALLLGGTFAWQSISQTALNEKEAFINPGGRLHDDFDGTNKNVYVENFADNDIFARVRLDEYFEIVMNKGTPAEKTEVVTTGATKDDTSTYLTHKFFEDNTTDSYWDWYTGGSAIYMPTFNKNKDSLKADINGTLAEDYEDYVEYEDGDDVTADATYDNDSNSVEDDGVTKVEETHYAKETGEGTLVSMEEWLQFVEDGEDTANYWVYDTDGWVYWSSPIKPDTATGLLLDKIALKGVMDDSYYYAINVTGQFITADDLGKDDGTGFYDTTAGTAPSKDALTLLEKIGVDVGETDDDDGDDDIQDDGTLVLKTEYRSTQDYVASETRFAFNVTLNDTKLTSSDNLTLKVYEHETDNEVLTVESNKIEYGVISDSEEISYLYTYLGETLKQYNKEMLDVYVIYDDGDTKTKSNVGYLKYCYHELVLTESGDNSVMFADPHKTYITIDGKSDVLKNYSAENSLGKYVKVFVNDTEQTLTTEDNITYTCTAGTIKFDYDNNVIITNIGQFMSSNVIKITVDDTEYSGSITKILPSSGGSEW